jgi:hypothetical protein
MKLVHYSGEPIGKLHAVEPPDRGALKPRGLWLSDDDCEENWRWWCVAEGFGLDRLTHVYDVELGNQHHGLLLDSAAAIDSFTEKYEIELIPDMRNGVFIDWARVMQEYSAIVCTPYIWARRLGPLWYYGWDCASGCVWDVSAIKSIRLREVVPVPQVGGS